MFKLTIREDATSTVQGTHLYAPPEWLEVGEYRGEQATVWSLGVLAFVMLQVGDTSKCHVSSC